MSGFKGEGRRAADPETQHREQADGKQHIIEKWVWERGFSTVRKLT